MNRQARHRKARAGFTLIEMALVLIVLGILTAVLLPPLFQLVKRDKISQGKSGLESALDDVIGYAMINDRLPVSLAQVGATADAWGSPFGYWVQGNITKSPPPGADRFHRHLRRQHHLHGPIQEPPDPGRTGQRHGVHRRLQGTEPRFERDLGHLTPPRPSSTPANLPDLSDPGDDIVRFVTINRLKALIGCGGNGSSSSSDSSTAGHISFADNLEDFSDPTHSGKTGEGLFVNLDDMSVELWKTSGSNVGGCTWYRGTKQEGRTNCTDGECTFNRTIKAYFNFQSNYTWSDNGGGLHLFGDRLGRRGGNGLRTCGSGPGLTWVTPGPPLARTPSPRPRWPWSSTTTRILQNDPSNVRRHLALVYWGDFNSRGNDNEHNEVDNQNMGGDNPSRGDNNPGQDADGIYKFEDADFFSNQKLYHVRVRFQRGSDGVNSTVWLTNSTDNATIADFQDLVTDYDGTGTGDIWKVDNTTVWNSTSLEDMKTVKFGYTMGSSAQMHYDIKGFEIRFE